MPASCRLIALLCLSIKCALRSGALAGLEHTMDRRATDANCARECTDGPAARRRLGREERAHASVGMRCDGHFSAAAWRIADEGIGTGTLKSPPPQRHGVRADTESTGNLTPRAAVSGEQHDARAADDALRRRAGTDPGNEKLAIVIRHVKFSPHDHRCDAHTRVRIS